MPTAERAGFVERVCSTCGKDMVFVSVIDKDTREWRPLEGMPLSGTLRKYRCRHCGHIETNEEDGLGNKFYILDENDPFRKAEDLVGYAEIHAKSERALMRSDHLFCLAYIAGWEIDNHVHKRNQRYFGQMKFFRSLRESPFPGMIANAREHLNAGDIPEDWLDQLTRQIEERG